MITNQFEAFSTVKWNRIARSYYAAATHLLDNNSVDAVTVHDILTMTKTSRQTFYNYFPSKNSFFNFVFFKNVNEQVFRSNPFEVLTQIIPSELSERIDYYSALCNETGQDAFPHFLRDYLQVYYQKITEKNKSEIFIEGILTSTFEAYSMVSAQLFIKWVTDSDYRNQHTARDVGLEVYYNLPASLYRAFSNPVALPVEPTESNIVNLYIGLLVGKLFLNKMIEQFMEKHPEIRINLIRAERFLSDTNHSVGLELSSYELADTNYETYKLCDHKVVVLVSKDNPLSKLKHAQLETFYDQNIILSSYRDKKMLIKALGNDDLNKVFSVNEISGCLKDIAVESNKGVEIKSSLDGYRLSEKVEAVEIDDFKEGKNPFKASLNLYIQKGYELSENERILARFIIDFAKSYDPTMQQ